MPDFKEPVLCNESRGEVPLQIGNVQLAIAITFGGLAQLSRVVNAPSMDGLYQRLLGFEPWSVSNALRILSVDPDGADAAKERAIAAIGVLTSADEGAWRAAAEKALTMHFEKGNALRAEVVDLADEVDAALAEGDAPGKPEAAKA